MSTIAINRLVNDATAEIISMLPAEPDHARLIVERVARHAGVRRSYLPCLLAAGLISAVIVGSVAWMHSAALDLAAVIREPQTNLRSRVLIWPEGRAELFLMEDRAGDPRQVLRVIRKDPISHAHLERIFGRAVVLDVAQAACVTAPVGDPGGASC